MLTAIRQSDGAKVIGEHVVKDSLARYQCEECGCSLVHHRPEHRVVIGHFNHKSGESHCTPTGGESIEHIETKLDIYNYIKNGWGKQLKLIEPEKRLFKGAVRPDVFVETRKGTSIAIEVQASAIGLDEIIRRTKRYYKEGIHVLWVLPFEFKKVYETLYSKFNRKGWVMDGYDNAWEKLDRVPFKIYEQFIYWAYFKHVLYWDLGHKYSDGFISVEYGQHRTEGSVFYNSDGNEEHYEGRWSKTLKVVARVIGNIQFNQLEKKSIGTEFSAKSIPFIIPPRNLFTFDRKKWDNLSGIRLPELRQRGQ